MVTARPRVRRVAAVLTSGVAALRVAPREALACAVCYGNAADPMLDGTRLSVVFMLLLTYLLLGGGGVLFVLARRRARRQAHPGAGAAPPATDSDLRVPQASTRGLV